MDCQRIMEHIEDAEITTVIAGLAQYAKVGGPITDPRFAAVLDRVHESVGDLSGKQVATSLHALAKMDYRDFAVLSRLCVEVLKKVHDFNSRAISNSLNALARLDHRDDAVLEQLCLETMHKATCFAPQQISNTLDALAKFQYRHDGVLEVLCVEVLNKASDLNPHDVAGTLRALAALGCFNKTVLDRLCLGLLAQVHNFNHQEISASLFALAKLDYGGEPVVSRLCLEALDKAHSFDKDSIVVCLWAVLCLRTQESLQLVPVLWDRLLEVGLDLDYHMLLLLRICQVSLRIEHPDFGLQLPPAVQARCDQGWHRQQTTLQTSHFSKFHMQVSHALLRMGIPHRNEQTVAGISVDIVIDNTPCVVEVDGPSHFSRTCTGELRAQGGTLFKRRLLQQCEIEVINVPFFEWNGRSSTARQNYLKKKLGAAKDPLRDTLSLMLSGNPRT